MKIDKNHEIYFQYVHYESSVTYFQTFGVSFGQAFKYEPHVFLQIPTIYFYLLIHFGNNPIHIEYYAILNQESEGYLSKIY